MGNQCCKGDYDIDDKQHRQSKQLLPHNTPIKNNQNNQITNQKVQYIDSQGNPLPNAYKRYVKPPTTVGRQSVIVRNLHQKDQVPEWIWATQNNRILDSGNHAGYNYNLVNNNRKTYQQIKGRFKGQQTVNMSKVMAQNRLTSSNMPPPTTGTVNYKPIYQSGQGRLQTNSLQVNTNKLPQNYGNPLDSNIKRLSANEAQVITSINPSMNPSKQVTQVQLKKTDSRSVLISPFQTINQNQPISSVSNLNKNVYMPTSNFANNSNPISVNNSFQQPSNLNTYSIKY